MKIFKFISKELVVIIFIIVILIAIGFPIYWMISSSFKLESEMFILSSERSSWLPEKLTLDNYKELFSKYNFGRAMINSAIIAVGTTILSLILGFPAAYGFSRFKFPGSSIMLLAILLVRLFTPAALIVPFYDLMRWLGLIDSIFAIIIGTTVINLPFVLWIMKAFFDDFPKELEEAARVDGCTNLTVFSRIVIPCSLPAIATLVLFSFTMGWNDFLFSISFARSALSKPATVAIANMITGYKYNWGTLLAGGTFLAIPVMIITIMLQKYFIKGLTMGAVKE